MAMTPTIPGCSRATSSRRREATLTSTATLPWIDRSTPGPEWTDEQGAEAFEVSRYTVIRTRERFVEHGLDDALTHRHAPRAYSRALDGEAEAHLIALACSACPDGQARWSLRLLAGRLVELGYVEQVSHETVRQTLKKTSSSPG